MTIQRNREERGYSLVVVMLTLGLVTVALFCLLAFLEAGVKTSADNIERRKMFYVCDGMTRIVAETLQGFMRTATLAPGVAGETALKTYLESAGVGGGPQLPNLVPEGFLLESYSIDDYVPVGDAVPVPTGAFSGMAGKEDQLRLFVSAKRADGKFGCTVTQSIALTQIGMFQMTLWSALPKTTLLHNTGGTDALFGVSGRVHTQGDLYLAEGADPARNNGVAFIEKLTSAGRIAGTCGGGVSNPFLIAKAELTTVPLTGVLARGEPDLLEVGDATPNPLVAQPCDVDPAVWIAAAGQTNDHVADVRFGIEPLKLPLPVPASEAEDPLRYLIEAPAADPAVDERERHRFAYKADLRIIDGVWYLANPANRGDWPGTPIWSDHPGHATALFRGHASAIAVGQDDIRTARGWVATPRFYSPYGYDPVTKTLQGDAFRAVSYGTSGSGFVTGLTDDPADPLGSARVGQNPPPATSVFCTRAIPPGYPAATTLVDHHALGIPCGAPWTATGYTLAAARWGFQDVTLTVNRATGSFFDQAIIEHGYGNILPINFSVQGLTNALARTLDKGELGYYFGGAGGAGRVFNGVVWISSRWPKNAPADVATDSSWTTPEPLLVLPPEPSFTPLVPPRHYLAGRQTTGSLPLSVPLTSHPPLPYPLCSDSVGLSYDDLGFQVHPCSGDPYTVIRHADHAHGAYPNALRIQNADRVSDPARLPFGLTIATDLPVYLVGNVNNALAAPAPRPGSPRALNWRPFAVAADNVVLLSRLFADQSRPWWNQAESRPTPQSSVYNVSILTGVGKGTGSCAAGDKLCGDSVQTGVRWMEDWGAVVRVIEFNGSIVLGYHAKNSDPGFPYGTQEFQGITGALFSAPSAFNLLFDHHLDRLQNQPPGTEALGIQSIRQWERD